MLSLYRNWLLMVLVLALTMTLATGCSRRQATIYVRGWEPMHVNERGESTPVDVRLYQLTATDAFVNASFEDLWLNIEQVLGNSLVDESRVWTVYPSSADATPVPIHLGALEPQTIAIGILALYRQARNPDQRRLLLTREQIAQQPVLHFHHFGVSLQKPEQTPLDQE